MTPASGKQKGRKFQQKCRDRIIKAFKPYGVLPDDVKSTAMGQGGEDIQLSPFAREYFPYSVECKKHKGFAIYNPYEQCKTNAPKGTTPVVFIEADRKQPLAVLGMEEFFQLLEKIEELRGDV